MSSNKADFDRRNEEEDEVELRKTLATSSNTAKETQPEGVASILCYCVASIMMTVVNKFVVSGRHFNMNFLMLCLQSVVGVSVVLVCRALGIINFRAFNKDEAKAWFPVSLGLVGMIYTGSKSLQFLSIPVYTIFKNLTIILIAHGEVLWFGGRVTGLTTVSFFFMVLSSLVAAWADIQAALALAPAPSAGVIDGSGAYEIVTGAVRQLNVGYLWMGVNCVISAAYLLTMRKKMKGMGFSDWDTMFYNNLLSIPVLVAASVLMEDWTSQNLDLNFPSDARNVLLFAIAFSGAAAVGISFTTAWCIRVTSSTTYSMVGALNKLPVAASGIIFFGDPATFGSISAISIGFFAGLLYAVAKNNQKKEESARAPGALPLTNVRR
ncbi:UDP-galactose transporter [Pterulicium gracile]|uniref:GDP-mannose transporter n=1 Tax=Pterulicium gracile TaxID=1884261 RepID=A0A5C3QR10_9AGAR|nr:UDP-galactose transporter [Pterula gracilis]